MPQVSPPESTGMLKGKQEVAQALPQRGSQIRKWLQHRTRGEVVPGVPVALVCAIFAVKDPAAEP